MKRETREEYGRLDAYPKTNKYGYDKPLKTRLGKSASDYRIEPVEEVKIVDGGNFNQLLIDENIKLKEEVQYLKDVIEELRQTIVNLDDLD
jgi:hypothetical protein